MKIVCFHPEAEVEALEAARYYEAKSPGLGLSFSLQSALCRRTGSNASCRGRTPETPSKLLAISSSGAVLRPKGIERMVRVFSYPAGTYPRHSALALRLTFR